MKRGRRGKTLRQHCGIIYTVTVPAFIIQDGSRQARPMRPEVHVWQEYAWEQQDQQPAF